MKRIRSTIIVNILVVMFSCGRYSPPIIISSMSDTIESEPKINMSDSIAEERRKQQELDYMDTTAIGNIHLNTTKGTFEEEKRVFLNESKSLGPLRIKSLTGFFYEDRLAGIEIISFPQTAHKDGHEFPWTYGWDFMYRKKYGTQYSVSSSYFQYVKGRKGIRVTDYGASDLPYSSFKEFLEVPLSLCYRDEPLFPVFNKYADAEMQIDRVLRTLPISSVKRFTQRMIDASIKYRDFSSGGTIDASSIIRKHVELEQIYNDARNEANQIIEHRNELNSNKHKNDPTWSIIIIGYIPAIEKYKEEQRIRVEKKEEMQQKEFEKI